jgi:hypothetical protein
MKALYPKAKLVKMQKRKVGPNQKNIQYVFIYISFDLFSFYILDLLLFHLKMNLIVLKH